MLPLRIAIELSDTCHGRNRFASRSLISTTYRAEASALYSYEPVGMYDAQLSLDRCFLSVGAYVSHEETEAKQ
jgi:hypothetical protein